MHKFIRLEEYKILLYRMFLVYFFYMVARVLFYFYNIDLVKVDGVFEFIKLAFHGLAFDTTAILYVNSLFILLSIIPLTFNTTKRYQKGLFYLYFITNGIAYATNFVDFIYYRFIFNRTSTSVMGSLEHETNKTSLFFKFILDYWHVYILFFAVLAFWIYSYKRVTLKPYTQLKPLKYFIGSLLIMCLVTVLCIGGIRGDFKHSTRPITLVDASRHVTNPVHSDIVLNTPFTIIRTIGKDDFKKVNYVSKDIIESNFKPIKQYQDSLNFGNRNVVVFIIESYGKEYLGAFNKHSGIPDYESHTPFIDSLAQHSLVFSNAYANGRKSIHGMSSVLAGIPSFKVAYTSSAYVQQPTQSIVSAYNDMGYDTSFFHGAPNGSMGFLGFSNVLGFDHYYGKTEYDEFDPDNDEFDGFWGIWDEPFFEYINSTLAKKQEPFMSSIFTLTSHSPYIIPETYTSKFPEGDIIMHKCVEYTDYAIQQFFETAKKEAWFENTIFVFTADHTNEIYYDEYRKPINRYAVPIMFYSPKGDAILIGENRALAQQIDIYPTLLNLSGYNKPFRSWGRSLIGGDADIDPFIMNHTGMLYQFTQGNYICIFDGNEAIGFYDVNDLGLEQNLIAQRNTEMNAIEQACKAFIQDYMERIIDRKLSAE
ncbi:MAG: LTA synthase family protein [Flavobacteriaceae bacterium]|nr:LTA synthase family protein [Flavobacteriaceae bacterium]